MDNACAILAIWASDAKRHAHREHTARVASRLAQSVQKIKSAIPLLAAVYQTLGIVDWHMQNNKVPLPRLAHIYGWRYWDHCLPLLSSSVMFFIIDASMKKNVIHHFRQSVSILKPTRIATGMQPWASLTPKQMAMAHLWSQKLSSKTDSLMSLQRHEIREFWMMI